MGVVTAPTLLAFAIALTDQGVKWILRRTLATRAISLGPAGRVALVHSRIWLTRGRAPSPRLIVAAWGLAVCGVVALATTMPTASLWAAALVGGSASHAIEMALRGSICDYVCLRFWPAFNLADVAITIGAIGMVYTVVAQLHR
jgi:lipoprotein signal peptidase